MLKDTNKQCLYSHIPILVCLNSIVPHVFAMMLIDSLLISTVDKETAKSMEKPTRSGVTQKRCNVTCSFAMNPNTAKIANPETKLTPLLRPARMIQSLNNVDIYWHLSRCHELEMTGRITYSCYNDICCNFPLSLAFLYKERMSKILEQRHPARPIKQREQWPN